jgi:hypothetical protein
MGVGVHPKPPHFWADDSYQDFLLGGIVCRSRKFPHLEILETDHELE